MRIEDAEPSNDPTTSDECREIPLTQGKVAIVDSADYDFLMRFKWCAHKGGAQTRTKDRCWLMHRLILDAPDGLHVDHVNHNRLDNRRSNLRLATPIQNQANRRSQRAGQYKGVHDRRTRAGYKPPKELKNVKERWFYASIGHNYKQYHLGYFATAEEAARAYDKKARELYGEFACVNFPEEVNHA